MVKLALAFGAGIWAAHRLDINLIYISMLVVLGFSLIAIIRHKVLIMGEHFLSASLLCLFWFAAGLLRMDLAQQAASGSVAEYDGQIVSIHGKISETPNITAGNAGEWKVRHTAEIDWIVPESSGQTPRAANGGAYLASRQQTPVTHGVAGDTVTARGKVHLFHAYNNPGQPDLLEMLAEKGIAARI